MREITKKIINEFYDEVVYDLIDPVDIYLLRFYRELESQSFEELFQKINLEIYNTDERLLIMLCLLDYHQSSIISYHTPKEISMIKSIKDYYYLLNEIQNTYQTGYKAYKNRNIK